jgi:hypothetical protein
LIEFFNEVHKEKEKIKTQLINHHYRHSSTSIMSNAIEEWKAQAKADCVGGRAWAGFDALANYTDRLIALLDPMEDE